MAKSLYTNSLESIGPCSYFIQHTQKRTWGKDLDARRYGNGQLASGKSQLPATFVLFIHVHPAGPRIG